MIKNCFPSVAWAEMRENAANSGGAALIYIESVARLRMEKIVDEKLGFNGNVEKF